VKLELSGILANNGGKKIFNLLHFFTPFLIFQFPDGGKQQTLV
jgi:hypothetical protein